MGLLTESQIKGHESELAWWDAVDIIGIDAYYAINGATLPEMMESWQQPLALARRLHKQHGKPVLYTEIGYCSGQCSRTHTPTTPDYYRHALQYQAVFEAFRNEQYFYGAFWWNWNTDPGRFQHGIFTPSF